MIIFIAVSMIFLWMLCGKVGEFFLRAIYRREVAPQFRRNEDERMPWQFFLIMPVVLPFIIWDYLYPVIYRRWIQSEAFIQEMKKYQ